MSSERKEIYVGEPLKRVLATRPRQSLTAVVNLIADRYLGLVSRASPHAGCSVQEDDVYRSVLAEVRRPLEARDIAIFPQMVEDWIARNPDAPCIYAAPTALARIKGASYVELLLLVDRIERAGVTEV